MTPNPTKCPNCGGRGRLHQFICNSADRRADGTYPPIFFDVTCPYCHGNGYLRPGSKKAEKVQAAR